MEVTSYGKWVPGQISLRTENQKEYNRNPNQNNNTFPSSQAEYPHGIVCIYREEM